MKFIALCLSVLTLVISAHRARCQLVKSDSSGLKNPAFEAALKVYSTSVGRQALIFNGVQYMEPERSNEENHPYYLSDNLEEGSIWYDGAIYENIPLLYNIWTDELIIEHFAQSGQVARIKIYQPLVNRFTFLQHTFIKLKKDSLNDIQPGFYDLLYDGNVKLFARRIKGYSEEITSQKGVEPIFTEKDRYYILKKGKLFSANNQGAMVKVLEDKKKNLKQFIRKNGLRFKSKKDQDATKLVQYYDQL